MAKDSYLAPQSVRTPEAAGFAMTGPPSAPLSFDYAENGVLQGTGSQGLSARVFVPAQLVRRRVYCFIYASTVVACNIKGEIAFYLNKSKVGFLPVYIDNTSGVTVNNRSLSLASNIADLGQAVIPNALYVTVDGQLYVASPYELNLQCDEIRVEFQRFTASIASTPVWLACFSN